MCSHQNKLTMKERTRAELILSMTPIPRVKSTEEAEARRKEMSKTYLKREEVKKKSSMKRLEERKGVSEKILVNGSKERGIKRMSQREISNRKPNGYNQRRIGQDTDYNKRNQKTQK